MSDGGITTHRTLVERIKAILLTPKDEWPRLDAEATTISALFTSYALILAAIPPVAGLVGGLLFGHSVLGITYRPSAGAALGAAVTQYILSIVAVTVLALIIDALAPRFGGQSNRLQAFKVAIYASTAGWVAGIFGLIPSFAFLGLLGIYSFYLLYLGLPLLMRAPSDKAANYTAVVIIATIIVFAVVGALTAPISGLFVRDTATSTAMDGSVSVPGVGTVDLSKLEAASKQIEAANERGPIKPVEPLVLQQLLPEAIGAYRRIEIESSGGGAGGIGGSQASARYEGNGGSIRLEVTDIAAAGAIAALGSALNVQANRQTDSGYEKTQTIDGRMVTEKWDSERRDGSYGTTIANRFMVQAEGRVGSIDELKGAVAALPVAKLEALAK